MMTRSNKKMEKNGSHVLISLQKYSKVSEVAYFLKRVCQIKVKQDKIYSIISNFLQYISPNEF